MAFRNISVYIILYRFDVLGCHEECVVFFCPSDFQIGGKPYLDNGFSLNIEAGKDC